MTSIQSVCLRIPTSLKATNTWARYLPSNLHEIVKTAFLLIYKKMLLPPNVRERERANSSPLCLPKESSGKRVYEKIKIKIKIHLIVFDMVSAKN